MDLQPTAIGRMGADKEEVVLLELGLLSDDKCPPLLLLLSDKDPSQRLVPHSYLGLDCAIKLEYRFHFLEQSFGPLI